MDRILVAALALCLSACSPALNWRSVVLPEIGLRASLPCKPDHLERRIELAGTDTAVDMAGCAADGVTFAVACAVLSNPAQAGAALAHWRAAVLAGLRAPAPGQPGAAQDSPFVPVGALDLPQSVRTVVQGRQPGGEAVHAQAVWFARVQGPQLSACHAVVLSAGPRAEVAEGFFSGLELQ
ncbi:hypothetical protein [Acidovorax sp. SRB_24]|uniref:hypothetical protein n=1 Tax=Acidovorax sp. SRB_24 TaxID=1962700 RepID=UPI00145F56B8|nr:hypothetical protein [Acidovorax sp. SRB_24]NMM76003.1 hypothetical protein [Acidovorax sp. SRB_24]